jgi:hypothetical protein
MVASMTFVWPGLMVMGLNPDNTDAPSMAASHRCGAKPRRRCAKAYRCGRHGNP